MIKVTDLLKKRIDFSPQEMRYKSSKFWGRTLIWTIVGSFGISFVYACFARIDEVVTTRGELQPYGSLRPIKMPFSAKVDEIFVDEGSAVNKNQLLIKLDTDVFEARKAKLIAELEFIEKMLISENDILIAPSRREGFGRSLIEFAFLLFMIFFRNSNITQFLYHI